MELKNTKLLLAQSVENESVQDKNFQKALSIYLELIGQSEEKTRDSIIARNSIERIRQLLDPAEYFSAISNAACIYRSSKYGSEVLQYELACAWLRGWGVEKRVDTALIILLPLSSNESWQRCYEAIKMLPHIKDARRIIENLEDEANKGNKKACCMLGYAFSTGAGVYKSYTNAYLWWANALRLGAGVSGYIAQMHFFGLGVQENAKEAARISIENKDFDLAKIFNTPLSGNEDSGELMDQYYAFWESPFSEASNYANKCLDLACLAANRDAMITKSANCWKDNDLVAAIYWREKASSIIDEDSIDLELSEFYKIDEEIINLSDYKECENPKDCKNLALQSNARGDYLAAIYYALHYDSDEDELLHEILNSLPDHAIGIASPLNTQKGTLLPENLVHRTINGSFVRSKSEVIISNMLNAAGIPYEYETDLTKFGFSKGVRPDFVFTVNNKIIIWEHLGLAFDPSYKERWQKKLAWYKKNGFTVGDNLFLTTDNEAGAIDSYELKTIINSIKAAISQSPEKLLANNNAIRFVFLDFETTGRSAKNGDRIIDIGAVKTQNYKEIDRFQSFCDPGLIISNEITKLTGIRQHHLSGSPKPETVIRNLLNFVDGETIVAHNAIFDLSFLNSELTRLNLPAINKALCTYRLAKRIDPGLNGYSLSALTETYCLPGNTNAHRALPDAIQCFLLFIKLMERLAENYGIKKPTSDFLLGFQNIPVRNAEQFCRSPAWSNLR